MKVSERDKRVLLLGLLAAAGIVGWTLVAQPMQQRWKRAAGRLQGDRAELKKLERVAQGGRYYADRRRQVARSVVEVDDLEAAQRVIPVLINEVEDCGHRRRVQITRYDPLPPKVEETYAVYSLTLSAQSDLSGLVEFLKDLRETRPVVSIKRLHITPPGPTAKTQNLTVEMTLSTYAIRKVGAKSGAATGT